jgi:hypothetical protein
MLVRGPGIPDQRRGLPVAVPALAKGHERPGTPIASRSAWRSYSTELSFATRSCCAIAPIGNLIGSSRARARSRCERLG